MRLNDPAINKICLATIIIGILVLWLTTSSLEQTAIIKEISQNDHFLNTTILFNSQIYILQAFTNKELPIETGDYIKFKGAVNNKTIQATKITKLIISN